MRIPGEFGACAHQSARPPGARARGFPHFGAIDWPQKGGVRDDPTTVQLLLGADNLFQGLAGRVEQADRQAAYWKNQARTEDSNFLVK